MPTATYAVSRTVLPEKLHAELVSAGIGVVTVRGEHAPATKNARAAVIVHDGVASDASIKAVVDAHIA